jgi:glycosyltransferase involved in cell wall biosynthesis
LQYHPDAAYHFHRMLALMKICFISEAHSIHTRRWTAGVAARGHEVHLISSTAAEIDGVVLHHRELYHANPLRTLRNVVRIRALIRALRPDVVHLFGLYSVQSLALLPLVMGWRNLLVSPWGTDIVHDGEHESAYSRFVKRFILGRARGGSALSQFLLACMQGYCRDTARFEVIPFGIDVAVFQPSSKSFERSTIVIGIAKNLTEKYGHTYLLQALPRVIAASPGFTVRVVILGAGPHESELKRQVRELKIDQAVTFIGHVSDQKKIRDHFDTFDIFAMPSILRSETLGVAAIEAGAMKIPVVASDIGGVPEAVRHMQTGILVKPRDIEALAQALITLIHDPEMRRRMGAAGRAHVEREFSIDTLMPKVDAMYHAAAGKD